jgi:hypothetical protein
MLALVELVGREAVAIFYPAICVDVRRVVIHRLIEYL